MVHNSPKHLGDYEGPIMNKICEHFNKLGYETYPHASLNFAWHGSLSDVDVLMTKDGFLYGVEIKSNRDNIKRANEQLEKLSCFVDYCYLATEKMPKRLIKNAGLIIVDDWGVRIIKDAPFVDGFDKLTFRDLKRICLSKVFNASKYGSKYEVANLIFETMPINELKIIFRKILLCSEDCSNCPLRSNYDSSVSQPSLLNRQEEEK